MKGGEKASGVCNDCIFVFCFLLVLSVRVVAAPRAKDELPSTHRCRCIPIATTPLSSLPIFLLLNSNHIKIYLSFPSAGGTRAPFTFSFRCKRG
jgi:hypothetical protein